MTMQSNQTTTAKRSIPVDAIAGTCESLLSKDRVSMDPTIAVEIDGNEHPIVVVEPETEQEVASILKWADSIGLRVCVSGSGTQLRYGNLTQPIDLLVRTLRMNRILEYSPADMTITVQPGVLWGDLRDHLAEHGQMIAIDPPCASHATIGGLVASDEEGPMRVLYGTLRDQIIGLRVVYPSGTVVRAGGKVVKNVAGYDMTKLFIGSLGTLAYISEITCKLKPLPLHRELCLISGSMSQVEAMSQRIIQSHLIPSTLEILSPTLIKSILADTHSSRMRNGHSDEKKESEIEWLAVGCDEVASAADNQTNTLRAWAFELGMMFDRIQQNQVEAFWNTYREVVRTQPIKLQIYSKATTIIKDGIAIKGIADSLKLPVDLSINRAQGSARLLGSEGEDHLQWERLILEARRIVERQNGSIILLDTSLEIRRHVDVFGQFPSTLSLMKGIKKAIDPTSIMNPGRFVGGI